MAEWTLSKIKKLIAQENPEGRKVRPGLRMAHVQVICADLWRLTHDPQASSRSARRPKPLVKNGQITAKNGR